MNGPTAVLAVLACGALAACAVRSNEAVAPYRPTLSQLRIEQTGHGRYALCAAAACPSLSKKSLGAGRDIEAFAETHLRLTRLDTPAETAAAREQAIEQEQIELQFRFGDSHLSDANKKLIRDALPLARKARRIVINGRTDNSGEPKANDKLALERALEVRNFIRANTPHVDNVIVIDAKGSCCYVAANDTPEGRSKNRRVEVVFQRDAS